MQPIPESTPFATEIFTAPWQLADLMSIDLGAICLMDQERQKKLLNDFAVYTGFEIRVLYQARQFVLRSDSAGMYLETIDKPTRRIRDSMFHTMTLQTHREICALFEHLLTTNQRQIAMRDIARGGETANIMAAWLHAMDNPLPKRPVIVPKPIRPAVSQSLIDLHRMTIRNARQDILQVLSDIVFAHKNSSLVPPICELRTADSGCRLSIRASETKPSVHVRLEKAFKTLESAAKSIVSTGAIRRARCREYYNAVPGVVIQRMTFAAPSNTILTSYQNDPAREIVVLAEDLYYAVDAVLPWTRKSFGSTLSTSVQGVYGRTYEFSLTQTVNHRIGEVIWNAHVATRSK